MKDYSYQGEFLNRFPQNARSLIANQFCRAVRSGCATVPVIIEAVLRDVRRRLRGRIDPERQAIQDQLRFALQNDEEAGTFAQFILDREDLPADERHQLKRQGAGQYRDEWMSRQPPTEKQLAYL